LVSKVLQLDDFELGEWQPDGKKIPGKMKTKRKDSQPKVNPQNNCGTLVLIP